jgi:hypothetical protein
MTTVEAKEIAEERVRELIDRGYIEPELEQEKVQQLIEKLLKDEST